MSQPSDFDLDLAALEAEIAQQEEAMPDAPQPATELAEPDASEAAAQEVDAMSDSDILEQLQSQMEGVVEGQLTSPSPKLQQTSAAEAELVEAAADDAQPEAAPASANKLKLPFMPKKAVPAATGPSSSQPAAASTSPAKPAVPKKKKLLVAQASVENNEPAGGEAAAKPVEGGKSEGAKLPAARPKTKATLKVQPTKKAGNSSAEGSDKGSDAPSAKPKAIAKARPANETDSCSAEGTGQVPAKPKVAGKKALAAKAGGSGEDAPKEKGPKRGMSAFMFFTEAKRQEVKAENPGIAFGQVSKLLGAKWGELSAAEKAPYQALAVADKQRYESEKAAAGPFTSAPKKGPKVKSAWELFCDERRAAVEKDNPKAGPVEVTKLLSLAYKELPEEDKAVFVAQHQELKAAVAAAGGSSNGSTAEGKRAAAGKKRRRVGAKGSRKHAKKDASDETEGVDMGGPEEVEGEEEECDWEAHPAERILSITSNGKYVVLRQGLGFTETALFEAAVAKQQRLGKQPAGDKPCPIPLALVEEFEQSERAFQRAVHGSSVGNDLELDGIPANSPLEACFILGLLREPGYALHKVPKGDIKMTVPVLATSKAVQRLVDAERARADAWHKRAMSAEALLAEAAGTSKGAVAATSPGTQKKKAGRSET